MELPCSHLMKIWKVDHVLVLLEIAGIIDILQRQQLVVVVLQGHCDLSFLVTASVGMDLRHHFLVIFEVSKSHDGFVATGAQQASWQPCAIGRRNVDMRRGFIVVLGEKGRHGGYKCSLLGVDMRLGIKK